MADGHPIVAIENKIGAPLRDDQLASYGRWITHSVRPNDPAIVCLLAHITQPPDNFLDGGQISGGAIPHSIKWQTVGRHLHGLTVSEDVPVEVKMLARELVLFLRESEMSNEFAGRDDFAAALVFLRAGSRMDHTFSSIYGHIKSLDGHFRRNESSREYSLRFDTEQKLICGWAYLTHPTLPGLFLGYGIALEPNTVFKQGTVPPHDSVFICLGAEGRPSMRAVRSAKNEPEFPWTYAELDDWVAVVTFKPLHDFLRDPENFAPKMIEWIDEHQADINAFVSRLK